MIEHCPRNELECCTQQRASASGAIITRSWTPLRGLRKAPLYRYSIVTSTSDYRHILLYIVTMVRFRGLSLALSLTLALGAQAEAKQHVPEGLGAASGAPRANSLSIRDSLARGDDPVELYKSVIMARDEAEAKGRIIDVPEDDLRAILDKIEELREDVDDLLSENPDSGITGSKPDEKDASNKDKVSDSDTFDADAILDSASFKQKLPIDKADIDAALHKSEKDKAVTTGDDSTTTTTLSSTTTRTVTLTRILDDESPSADAAADAANVANVNHKAVDKPSNEAAKPEKGDNKKPAQAEADEATISSVLAEQTPIPDVEDVKDEITSVAAEAPEATTEEVTSIQPSTNVISIETPEPSSSTEPSSPSTSIAGPQIKIAKPEEEDSPMLRPSPTPVDPVTPVSPVIQTPNLSFTLPAVKPAAKVAGAQSDSPFPTPVETPAVAASVLVTELTPSVPAEDSVAPTTVAASEAPAAETVDAAEIVETPKSVPVIATPSGFKTVIKS